jgi:PPP family 3-phenylpropionic acid transporter
MIKSRVYPGLLSPIRRGSLYYLGFWASVGSFAPFINLYYLQLGLSGQQVGWLATIFPLTTLLFAMPLANLADRRHWRIRILRVAIAGSALTFFLLGIPRTFTGLVWLVILLSFFFTPIVPLADSVVARMAARHGLNYGRMRLWGSFGFATVAVICGFIWERVGFAPMFAVTSLMLIPVIWYAGWLEEGTTAVHQSRRSPLVILQDSGLMIILAASFLVGLAIAVSVIFEGIYMDSLGGSKAQIGLLFGVAAFSELPTMYYSGLLGRYLRGPKVLLLAYGLMGGAYLGYALIHTPGMMLLLAAVKGLGFGLFFVSTVRLVDARAPEEWSSTAQAMLSAGIFGVAPLIAGPLGGAIYDSLGVAAVFLVGATAVGLAAVVILVAMVSRVLEETVLSEQ